MSVPVHTPARAPAPIRPPRRSAVGEGLLDALEALVTRHRALLPPSPEDRVLHAELITTEVAQELAVARSALRRTPHLIAVEQPGPAR